MENSVTQAETSNNGDTPVDASCALWQQRHCAEWSASEKQQLADCYRMFEHNGASLQSERECVFGAAATLTEMGLQPEVILATTAHALVRCDVLDLETARKRWGDAIADLIIGVQRMDVIQEYQERSSAHDQSQSEALRKMVLAMVADVRVVLIKLATRLETLRRIKQAPDKLRREVAHETMDIFAPLANRLGIWQLKWELEDLSFRFLQPDLYKRIASQIAERRDDRHDYLQGVVEVLRTRLQEAGLQADVSARPKHIYSIWRKMQRKQVEFSEIYDVRALRVLVNTATECYTALGVTHGLWPNIPREFDDYIANPKQNNYRSLHTAVVGPGGKTLEVQIRTHEMHASSELGVAAHWRYKEGGQADAGLERKVAWLRQLLEWKDEVADSEEFVEHFHAETLEDVVYVFTPQGRIIDLPLGSTPIDFAYAVHTSVGHRCRGAKVNGRMVQLTHALQTGDQVEILTAREGGPSRDWLNPHLGYIHTSRARSRVRTWYRQLDIEKVIAEGRAQLEREMQRHGVRDRNHDKIAEALGFPRLNDLLAALGRGEVGGNQLAEALGATPLVGNEPAPDEAYFKRGQAPENATGIVVDGVGDLLTHMAGCCKPVPPEPIVGYITRGRGVTIHLQDCREVLEMGEDDQKRLIEVSWSNQADQLFPVSVVVTAYDRSGLLRDITGVLANERVNVVKAVTQSDRKRHQAEMLLTLEINDLGQLHRVLGKILQLRNVIEARRA
jgi:GTP pyrophosphokinase